MEFPACKSTEPSFSLKFNYLFVLLCHATQFSGETVCGEMRGLLKKKEGEENKRDIFTSVPSSMGLCSSGG